MTRSKGTTAPRVIIRKPKSASYKFDIPKSANVYAPITPYLNCGNPTACCCVISGKKRSHSCPRYDNKYMPRNPKIPYRRVCPPGCRLPCCRPIHLKRMPTPPLCTQPCCKSQFTCPSTCADKKCPTQIFGTDKSFNKQTEASKPIQQKARQEKLLRQEKLDKIRFQSRPPSRNQRHAVKKRPVSASPCETFRSDSHKENLSHESKTNANICPPSCMKSCCFPVPSRFDNKKSLRHIPQFTTTRKIPSPCLTSNQGCTYFPKLCACPVSTCNPRNACCGASMRSLEISRKNDATCRMLLSRYGTYFDYCLACPTNASNCCHESFSQNTPVIYFSSSPSHNTPKFSLRLL